MKTTSGAKVRMLLVYPDYMDESTTMRNTGGSYSEGLASISAVVKSGGHSVSLMHLRNLHTREMFIERLNKMGEFDLIGFSVRTTAFPDVKKYISYVKEAQPSALVICGGYHVTLVSDEVLAVDGVDVVCIGDGEYAELELCNKISAGEDYTNIESLHFKLPSGEIKKNSVRALHCDLESLPIPDFELFDYENLDGSKINTATVMMSRGCIFSCTYCGNSQFRNVYPNKKDYARFRSPENGILYLKTLLAKYPFIKFISFRDAIFNMFPKWFDEFIELYKKEIGLPFTCNLRFDVLDEDTVRRMKEAGCYTIDVGVESGDSEIRSKYLKRYMTDEQMINACEWFHKYKITTLTYNILGLPHENLSKALKTIKLNAKLKSDRIIPNIFYPYPMTVLHDLAKEAGFVPEVIPVGERVPLIQKDFPKHEVLFAANFFLHYVNRYKKAYAMKKMGSLYEKWLDFWFLGPLTPRRTLVVLSDAYHNLNKGTRKLIASKSPKLYLSLRKYYHKIQNR